MLKSCLIEVLDFRTVIKEWKRLVSEGRDELRANIAQTRMNLGNCLSSKIPENSWFST